MFKENETNEITLLNEEHVSFMKLILSVASNHDKERILNVASNYTKEQVDWIFDYADGDINKVFYICNILNSFINNDKEGFFNRFQSDTYNNHERVITEQMANSLVKLYKKQYIPIEDYIILLNEKLIKKDLSISWVGRKCLQEWLLKLWQYKET